MKMNLSKQENWSFETDNIDQIKDDTNLYYDLCDKYKELGG